MTSIRETYEKQLEAVGERMGLLMQKSSEAEKERFRKAKSEVEDFAQELEQKGKYADRSCLFAAWIIGDPDISDEELKMVAKEYIEVDHLLIKSYKDEEDGKSSGEG